MVCIPVYIYDQKVFIWVLIACLILRGELRFEVIQFV